VIKDNSTYDVPKLMIGSRGTLGIIATVTLKLFRKEKNFSFTPPRNISNITPIHIKIKNAFDPENLFNPFLMEKIYGKL
jgi:FAD/FMN-containing dehydrogenase